MGESLPRRRQIKKHGIGLGALAVNQKPITVDVAMSQLDNFTQPMIQKFLLHRLISLLVELEAEHSPPSIFLGLRTPVVYGSCRCMSEAATAGSGFDQSRTWPCSDALQD